MGRFIAPATRTVEVTPDGRCLHSGEAVTAHPSSPFTLFPSAISMFLPYRPVVDPLINAEMIQKFIF